MHFSSYLERIANLELQKTITTTAEDVFQKVDANTSTNHCAGLLLGNVQSGKTAQMLGVVGKLADEGFSFFIILTTDNVYLQKQTLDRACDSLGTMEIMGENDELRFRAYKSDKPIVLVLKKNTNVLSKWRNNIASTNHLDAAPIVVIDDEADAASLNTLVNKKNQSTINKHLSEINKLASTSVYIQVTATPQAILLQHESSGYKPSFVSYFEPGFNYLGGDFFYSKPKSYCIKYTDEDELINNKQEDFPCSDGLLQSLISYLVVCAHFYVSKERTCNFLIHPSVKIADHEQFATQIGGCLNNLLDVFRFEETQYYDEISRSWNDLKATKPDITDFEDVISNISKILEEGKINLVVLNSTASRGIDLSSGFNIIIGGNSLGRGITIPALQTVYYCRKSKTPQADTFWQHCRMFGYDRVDGLCRIFIPPTLHKLFCDLNESNSILINQIKDNGLDGVQLIFSSNISPTRKNVIAKEFLSTVNGGINYFPNFPSTIHTEVLNQLLSNYESDEEYFDVEPDLLILLLQHIYNDNKLDWDSAKYINCIKGIHNKRPSVKYTLIVRRDRDISKGTGTLLSPNDRKLSDSFKNAVTLTMYRIIGQSEKGWNDENLWIPNIRFPDTICFYDIGD